jgi:hypothetical protein
MVQGSLTWRRCLLFIAALALMQLPLWSRVSSGANFGRYVGVVEVKWLPDGRNMETLSDFEYIDPDQQSWFVPKGTKTDGASVPRALWILYAPFSGLYRDSALVHDHYCQNRTRTWQETHEAFYNGLRASGVSEHDSQMMWAAVYLFGPRWDRQGNRSPSMRPDIVSEEQQLEELKLLENWINRRNPSQDELERALFDGAYRSVN